jgi:transcriptional regulator GlxA family with amidase domain
VVLFDEVELLDVAGPLEVFSRAGRHWNWRPFKVFTVAEKAGPVSTRGQLTVLADHAFDTCPPTELLLVPGGYGARRALQNEAALQFVKQRGAAAERILALGNGALLLAKAGLTADAEISAPADALELLAEIDPSARGTAEPAIHESGKLLSASASGQAVALALLMVSRILGSKQAAQVAAALGSDFDEGPRKIVVEAREPAGND